MSAASALPGDRAPLLVVTDVAARLVRRGLLAPSAAAAGGWVRARLLVLRHGPVVCEWPPGTRLPDAACDLFPRGAR